MILIASKSNPDPWKAVIAFSGEEGLGVSIIWCSPGLMEDLQNNGLYPSDCFESNLGPGVFVWEGVLHSITYPSTPDHPEEYDVEYVGRLRGLTDREWNALRKGENPLTVGSGDAE